MDRRGAQVKASVRLARCALRLTTVALCLACSRPPSPPETDPNPTTLRSESQPTRQAPRAAAQRPNLPSAPAGPGRRPRPAATLEHDLRPFPDSPHRVHRFQIPLSQVRFSFVDLGYRIPLVEAQSSAALVFNGGYWAYSGERRVIQGLVVVEDVQHARKTAASGGVLSVRAGHAHLFESRAYRPQPNTALALQCSPRLVVDGRIIPKLNDSQHAARTALCVGEDNGSLQVYLTEPEHRPTLQQLAQFLLQEGCTAALNLDGGPSTAAVARIPAPDPSARHKTPLTIGQGVALPYGIGIHLRP